MTLAIAIVSIMVLMFGFVVLFGAPYLPTLKKQTGVALDMLDLRPGQTLLELGSGDGTVALAAARRGLRVIGYELNPVLVIVSRLRCLRHRRQVKIHWGNFWSANWPETDGVFVFLLDKYMNKLDKKVIQNYPGKHVKLVSFAFRIPGKKPVLDRSGLYYYEY